MTTIELLEKYLKYFFIENNPEKLCSLLTEDIHCYGFAEDKIIENLTQGKEMLNSKEYREFMTFQLEIIEKKVLSEDCALVVYTLSHNTVTIKYRLVGTSKEVNGKRKLWLLNFAMINPNMKRTLFEDILNEKRMREEQYELQMQILNQNKAVIEFAAAFAKIWVITYDTKKKICYPDERLREKFHFPKAIPNFPDSMFDYNYILLQYRELYCNAFHQLPQKGEVDFDIQTKYPDGSIHWIRFRGKMLPEAVGNGIDAAISAQEIDTEKAMEARI